MKKPARLATVIRQVFRRQLPEVLSQVNLGKTPKLSHWNSVLADAAKPLLAGYYLQGLRDQKRRNRKRIDPLPKFEIGLDVFRPEVLAAVDAASMKFAESTNATAVDQLDTAIRKLKDSLKEGLEKGKALRKLTLRVKEIFGTPRAELIAQTEASRAVHAGHSIAAEADGLEVITWLASPDACPLCLDLDGVTIKLGESFATDAYGPVKHPPRHPGCFCSATFG